MKFGKYEAKSTNHPAHEQFILFFDNGYGASIIRGPYTYGGPEGLFELAVLKGNKENYDICYETSITDDVRGWLSVEEVASILQEIESLK